MQDLHILTLYILINISGIEKWNHWIFSSCWTVNISWGLRFCIRFQVQFLFHGNNISICPFVSLDPVSSSIRTRFDYILIYKAIDVLYPVLVVCGGVIRKIKTLLPFSWTMKLLLFFLYVLLCFNTHMVQVYAQTGL